MATCRPTCVPWAADAEWHRCQRTLRTHIAQRPAAMGKARHHAAGIAHWRDRLADVFDTAAPVTCARCPAPCCRRAKVWLDFKDLLFIHLTGETPPSRQLRGDLRGPCRRLGPQGCTLPHRSRPWICAWYVCPDLQRAIERDFPGGAVQVAAIRRRIKRSREAMDLAVREALPMLAARFEGKGAFR